MEVQQAVHIAKKQISTLFHEEGVRNIGLEEVEFDEAKNIWIITIGFSRAWDENPRNALTALTGDTLTKRSYKVLRIEDDTGEVLSVKSHAFTP